MRDLQKQLRDHCNYDLVFAWAVHNSTFISTVWLCFHPCSVVCSFLDTHSRQRLFLSNSILYVESRELSLIVTTILFQIPCNGLEETEVPTPPLGQTGPWTEWGNLWQPLHPFSIVTIQTMLRKVLHLVVGSTRVKNQKPIGWRTRIGRIGWTITNVGCKSIVRFRRSVLEKFFTSWT